MSSGRKPIDMRDGVKCGHSVNRFVYGKDAILKSPSSLTEDRKNVKPVRGPMYG